MLIYQFTFCNSLGTIIFFRNGSYFFAFSKARLFLPHSGYSLLYFIYIFIFISIIIYTCNLLGVIFLLFLINCNYVTFPLIRNHSFFHTTPCNIFPLYIYLCIFDRQLIFSLTRLMLHF